MGGRLVCLVCLMLTWQKACAHTQGILGMTHANPQEDISKPCERIVVYLGRCFHVIRSLQCIREYLLHRTLPENVGVQLSTSA